MPLDPNIRALQFAEQELKDHDRREAELKAEFRELKKTRAGLAARVQECIDVLCGKRTPDLFADVSDEQPETQVDGITIVQCPKCLVFSKPGQHECGGVEPIVCAPVGDGLLRDIPGITQEDADRMAAVGLTTLAVLGEECDGDLDNAPGLLESWVDEFTRGDADRIAKAIERHLNPATVPPAPEIGVVYPLKEDWRAQGLALMGLNEKLLKACKRSEVFTVGELHDWIDEESRDRGGFFGPGVLAAELERIGKIAAKWAKANAEILYQFFADRAFLGVPEKEAA